MKTFNFILLLFVYKAKASTMRVLQFGVDETIKGPGSYAKLLNHNPAEEFPEAFTLCYRSKTMVNRHTESANSLELPSNDGHHHWIEFYIGYTTTTS